MKTKKTPDTHYMPKEAEIEFIKMDLDRLSLQDKLNIIDWLIAETHDKAKKEGLLWT